MHRYLLWLEASWAGNPCWPWNASSTWWSWWSGWSLGACRSGGTCWSYCPCWTCQPGRTSAAGISFRPSWSLGSISSVLTPTAILAVAASWTLLTYGTRHPWLTDRTLWSWDRHRDCAEYIWSRNRC